VVIKVFFSVLVLCTTAVVAVVLAIHFRVKRHLKQESPASAAVGPVGIEEPKAPASLAVGLGEAEESADATLPPVIQGTASGSSPEHSSKQAS
jgi:hypothetical protein